MLRPRVAQARDFITENQIFQIKPRHGILEAGATAMVTLKYRPEFEGACADIQSATSHVRPCVHSPLKLTSSPLEVI